MNRNEKKKIAKHVRGKNAQPMKEAPLFMLKSSLMIGPPRQLSAAGLPERTH